MTQAILTEEEIVEVLKRTSLPTLLVEGVTEAPIYRHLRSLILATDAELLICNGRETLLAVWRRRGEFINTRVAFLADQDMWLFQPELMAEYPSIIWTTGYCIENDLFVIGKLEKFLEASELSSFQKLISVLSEWFTLEVQKFLSNETYILKTHIKVLCPNGATLCSAYSASRNYSPKDSKLAERISRDYRYLIRGKQIFQALQIQLSAPRRRTKYSNAQLLDIALKGASKADWVYLTSRIDAALG